MAGNILLKEFSSTPVTITSSGGSTTNGSATSAGTIDLRSGGTANLIQAINAFFELTAQWATVTSIVSGTTVADLYLVPAVDGTNNATVDTTSGAGFISPMHRFGAFINTLASPSTATNYRFVTAVNDFFPAPYTVYIINRSGQTISANWTLKVYAAQAQYT